MESIVFNGLSLSITTTFTVFVLLLLDWFCRTMAAQQTTGLGKPVAAGPRTRQELEERRLQARLAEMLLEERGRRPLYRERGRLVSSSMVTIPRTGGHVFDYFTTTHRGPVVVTVAA